MKLRQLRAQGFRCITDARLSLDPEFTLLVGGNGSGKTAWLDAAAIALGSLLVDTGLKVPTFREEQRQRLYVNRRYVVDLELAATTAVRAYGDLSSFLGDGHAPSHQLEMSDEPSDFTHRWQREVTRGGKTSTAGLRGLRRGLPELWSAVRSGSVADLPVFAYYGSGRLWNTRRDLTKRREKLTSIFEGYVGCLDPTSDQHLMRSWLQWRETRRFQTFQENPSQYMDLVEGKPHFRAPPDPPADAVGHAVARSFAALRGGAVMPVVLFGWNPGLNSLTATLQDREGEVQIRLFDELSDGYRSYVGLVADLAWRCVRLNPHLGERAPEEARGVVLIDEVDLNLHPAWQLVAVQGLRAAFPNLQFIATTHAPSVVSSVPAHQVRILDRNGHASTPDFTEGRDANSLLREVFGAGTRSTAIEARLNELDEAIASGDVARARTMFAALRATIGPGDGRLMGLEWELTAAEQDAARGS